MKSKPKQDLHQQPHPLVVVLLEPKPKRKREQGPHNEELIGTKETSNTRTIRQVSTHTRPMLVRKLSINHPMILVF